MQLSRVTLLALMISSLGVAQRAFESGGRVYYDNAQGIRTNLGIGFSPILMNDGKIAMLRGHLFDYGEKFDCSTKEGRNWVALYDPVTREETVLFDRTIPFDNGKWKFCTFEQMQLSSDRSRLYLVSPVYATSGSLAIVSLPRGTIRYVPGVDLVYVINSGAHRDELIYQRRVWRNADRAGFEHPGYPFIHARADGSQIAEISDEAFERGVVKDDVPRLREYLRKIGGRIHVDDRTLP